MTTSTSSTSGPGSLRQRWHALVLGFAVIAAACSSDTPQSLVASGRAYAEKGDHKAAVIQFKSALRLDPQAVEARTLLGRALATAGDHPGAALELEKALAQGASPDVLLPELMQALKESDQSRRIVDLPSQTLKDPLAQASVQSVVAGAWMRLGDTERAEAAIARALEARPDFAGALVLRAQRLAAAGDLPAAAAAIDAAAAGSGGGRAEAWAMKGDLAGLRPDGQADAEAAYGQALELDPRLVKGHAGLIAIRLRANDLAGAERSAAALRSAWPSHPMTAFVDAQIAYQRRDLPKARERVQMLLKTVPDQIGVLQLAGAIESELGSIFTAETYLQRAVGLAPGLPNARRALARVLSRQGQIDRTLQVLAPLLGPQSNDADALILAGEAQLKRGSPLQAEQLFQRAARLAPGDEKAMTMLAVSHLARGDAASGFALLEDLARTGKALLADQALVSARLKRREFDAAVAAIDAMERKSARSAATVELRGRIELARPDHKAARQAFEEALRLDPSLFVATSSLASIDVAENRLDAAQARLQASVAQDPRNHLALLALADLSQKREAPTEETRVLLQRAVQAAPDRAETHVRLMEFLLRKRLFRETLTAAQEAAAALPQDPGLLDVVGQAQMAAGDLEQALKSFQRLAVANDRSPTAYLRMAELHRVSNERERAETALKRALEIDPDHVDAQASLLALLTLSGRTDEALAFARGLQRRAPDRAGGYLAEGAFHQQMKAPDLALAAYRSGMAATKDPVLARVAYDQLLKSGRRSEARTLIASWERSRPYDPAEAQQVAAVEVRHKELASAEQRLARVVKEQPENLVASNNLAWLMTQRGDPGAVAMARRAAELAPNNPAVLDTLAGALAASRRFDEALAVHKRALDLSPGSHDLRLSYAGLALKAGRLDVARAEVERLRALGTAYGRQADVEKLGRGL